MSLNSEKMIKQVHEIDAEVMTMITETNRIVLALQKQFTGDKWLTVEEAARYIKKSVTHLRSELKDKIGYSKPEREILFKVEDLDRYLMQHYHPAKD